MKIYFYDTDTGIYQGEGFADSSFQEGSRQLPSGATFLAPPPYRSGEAPVFQSAPQRWVIRSLATIRSFSGENV